MNLEINLTKAVQFIEKFYEALLKDSKTCPAKYQELL